MASPYNRLHNFRHDGLVNRFQNRLVIFSNKNDMMKSNISFQHLLLNLGAANTIINHIEL